MKVVKISRAVLLGLFLATASIACTDKKEQAEENEEAQAGEVYNSEQQGVEHENRDNQFPDSRNDNSEGNGLETGAPTDTIDGDGDKGTNPANR